MHVIEVISLEEKHVETRWEMWRQQL